MTKHTYIIRILEYFRYHRLKGNHVLIWGDGNYYFENNAPFSITSTDAKIFDLYALRVGTDMGDCYIDKENPLEFNLSDLNYSLPDFMGDEKYFFKSLQYFVDDAFNNTILNDRESASVAPASMVILTKSSSTSDMRKFKEFFEVDWNTWYSRYLQVVNNAKDGIFHDFVKYDPRIFKDELNITNRIAILRKISSSSISEDLLSTLIGMIENIKDEDAGNFLDSFFEVDNNGDMPFRKLVSTLSSSDEFLLIINLIQLFYKRYKNFPDDLKNQVENLVETQIIPVFSVETMFRGTIHKRGAYIYSELNNNTIQIIKVDIFDGLHGSTSVGTIDYLENQQYSYLEVIGIVPTSSIPEAGLLYNEIYPIPAFALRTFNETFSDKYTFFEALGDIFNAAGIIVPFFRAVSGLNVLRNLFEMGILIIDINLGSWVQSKLKDTEIGEKLLYTYSAIMLMYSTLDVLKAIAEYGQIVIRNFDDLDQIWSFFSANVNYDELLQDAKFKEMYDQIQKNRTVLPQLKLINQIDNGN